MPRKRYYKKRRYTKKEDFNPVAALVVLFIIGGVGFYQNYIKPNIDEINNFAKILLPILIGILVLSFGYWIYIKIKKNKVEKERINNIPNSLRELESKIREFKPIRQYKEEKLYQTELVGFLKNNYPNLKIEETRDYSRPDIIIDDIAIEIKGPTDMNGMKTLPDKINSYLPKWNYLFIVLFNIQIVSNNTEKNKIAYNNKKKQILENTIESKRDKIFFIEI